MSFPEILLIITFVGAFLAMVVFAVILEWKRTQAYEGAMEAIQESAPCIADSMETIAFNMTLYNSRHVPKEAE